MSPLRVVILTSRRAPGLEHLLERDSRRGRVYEIAGVFASDPQCVERALCAAHDVPFAALDLRAFAAQHHAAWTDLAFRAYYDAVLLETIAPWAPDAIACAGYLHILTPRLLEALDGRVINVHDADLAITDEHGRARYRGLRATRDAILAGEPETRCTVHLVTAALDEGPILARSRAFPVHACMIDDARRWVAADVLKAYAYAQREWMMRAAFGQLLSHGIQFLANEAAAPAHAGAAAARAFG
ncbi:MAG TPA: formyltransferase family protein [Gemmatimonadaceae bacterium]|nr:formyltransferase family protein [Gemmatimonadaceae bacterium]